MSYKISGVEIPIQPTVARWLPRRQLGDDGNGRPIYSAVREFEMRWQLADPSHVNTLQGYFNGVGATGTAVVDLPQYAAATYVFFAYSGTVLQEPTFSPFFAENITDVVLMVTKIRT